MALHPKNIVSMSNLWQFLQGSESFPLPAEREKIEIRLRLRELIEKQTEVASYGTESGPERSGASAP